MWKSTVIDESDSDFRVTNQIHNRTPLLDRIISEPLWIRLKAFMTATIISVRDFAYSRICFHYSEA